MGRRTTVLFVGDIVGQPGQRALTLGLKGLAKRAGADLVIVNGENADDGHGIKPVTVEKLFSAGADVITTGNHVWFYREIREYLETRDHLLRPANYPGRLPGVGGTVVERGGIRYAVLQVQGRERMAPIDCPFRKARELLRDLRSKADVFLCEFHAEAPAEKEALAYYLDGTVACVVGTHTHVQTADERVFPQGTGYITDIGMSGPRRSIIGFDVKESIRRSLTQLPIRTEVADNPADLCGVSLAIDVDTGRTLDMHRHRQEVSV